MTRITTITSGLPGLGKTQLVINIALELVRRGRRAGVFYARECSSPIEDQLMVQPAETTQRRAGDSGRQGLLRSGYLGLDIVSCGTPLLQWPMIEAEQRTRCLREMEALEDYDDFLMDTSGMDPRTLLACCRVSSVVVLVVSAEPRSHAQAFALIRVLQLNGFRGKLQLFVNKARYLADAKDIHDELYRQVNSILGLDIPLLGVLLEDENINTAARARQAFSSIFPDSGAAASIFMAVDALDEIPVQCFSTPCTLPALWQALIEVIPLPVTLTGDARLDGEVKTVQQQTGQ